MAAEIVLVRHGETEWSRALRHTGRTDVALNAEGRRQAELLARALAGKEFALVLTSPLARSRETSQLAGFGEAQPRDDLAEWDYGDYEGRTTAEIREQRPGWTLFRGGVPNGETLEQVGERADRILAEAASTEGGVLLFAHGHLLRVLAARWLGLDPAAGRLFALDPATLSTLGHEREQPVLRVWNERVG